MHIRMGSRISKTLHLSLEDFYNQGMTPEEAKTVIEGIKGRAYNCVQSGLNRNWNVPYVTDPQSAAEEIEHALKAFIYKKHGIPLPFYAERSTNDWYD